MYMPNSYSPFTDNRTAGLGGSPVKTIQAWKKPKTIDSQYNARTTQNQIITNLEKASKGKVGHFDVTLKNASAYSDAGQKIDTSIKSEGYKFEDVVDVINPLHHLPLINIAYRNITGDELHPMSQIIGGAIYGGPVGAITGTVNAVSKVQTGKDLGDHALSMVGIENNSKTASENTLTQTAQRMEHNISLDNLPATTLSFVNMAEPYHGKQYIEYIHMAEGRTAGKMAIEKYQASATLTQKSLPKIDINALPPRETITTISMDKMPPRQGV